MSGIRQVDMGIVTSITLKDILRSTLTKVERSTELNNDDPALLQLKQSLVRSVAELEVKREQEPQTDAPTADLGGCKGFLGSIVHGSHSTPVKQFPGARMRHLAAHPDFSGSGDAA
jgi:hypothetical protein